MNSRNIDHGTMETEFLDDTNADPEGAKVRSEANQRSTRTVPPWVAEEFGFVFTARLPAGISEEDKKLEQMKDSNWRFQAHAHIVASVIEQCEAVYNTHKIMLESNEEGKEMLHGYYKHLKGLITFAAEGAGGDQWCAYGLSLAAVSQGCKEVASAVRFAMRAESWQVRLNQEQNTEEMGPTNMLAKATDQALRGVAICESMIKAYNSTITDPKATRLKLNFQTATYTALGIEASSKGKNYDHPGKTLVTQAASAGAANTLFAGFHGK